MWQLYLTAQTTATRPSRLIQIDEPWIALQFDNAVTLVGRAIEGALNEMEKRGTKEEPRWEPKYTMKQLLDPHFKLPAGETDLEEFGDLQDTRGIIYDEVQ